MRPRPQPDGSPRWPVGIIGSMSHTDDPCAAAVTRAPNVLAVGIDVERDTPLDDEPEGMIHTASEQAWIRQQDPLARGRLGKMFFSAEEAFHTCQHGLTTSSLDFTDVEPGIDMTRQMFRVLRVDAPVAPGVRWQDVRGRFGTTGGHLLTRGDDGTPIQAAGIHPVTRH